MPRIHRNYLDSRRPLSRILPVRSWATAGILVLALGAYPASALQSLWTWVDEANLPSEAKETGFWSLPDSVENDLLGELGRCMRSDLPGGLSLHRADPCRAVPGRRSGEARLLQQRSPEVL